MDTTTNPLDQLHGYYFEDLEEGMTDVFAKTITAIDLPVPSEWLIGLLIGHTVTPSFDGTRRRGKNGHTFLHGGEVSDGKIGPFMGVIGVPATEKIAASGSDIGIDQVNQPAVLSGIALNR